MRITLSCGVALGVAATLLECAHAQDSSGTAEGVGSFIGLILFILILVGICRCCGCCCFRRTVYVASHPTGVTIVNNQQQQPAPAPAPAPQNTTIVHQIGVPVMAPGGTMYPGYANPGYGVAAPGAGPGPGAHGYVNVPQFEDPKAYPGPVPAPHQASVAAAPPPYST